MQVMNIPESYTKAKGKINLNKSPKIYKHRDRKTINGRYTNKMLK